MTDLTDSLGGCCSLGVSINDAGQIAGNFNTKTAASAFLYSYGQVTFLGNLGRNSSESHAINNSGEVVGSAQIPSGTPHAFLYSNGHMADLNNLVDLDPALRITLFEATGINNKGQIVAEAYGPGFSSGFGEHAFLLTPLSTSVPEPNTLALSAVALIACASLRTRRH